MTPSPRPSPADSALDAESLDAQRTMLRLPRFGVIGGRIEATHRGTLVRLDDVLAALSGAPVEGDGLDARIRRVIEADLAWLPPEAERTEFGAGSAAAYSHILAELADAALAAPSSEALTAPEDAHVSEQEPTIARDAATIWEKAREELLASLREKVAALQVIPGVGPDAGFWLVYRAAVLALFDVTPSPPPALDPEVT